MEMIEKATFDWADLDGKTLVIRAVEEFDSLYNETTTVVMGFEPSTGHYYWLHTNTKRNIK